MAIDALPKGSGIYVIRNLVNSKAYVGSALCVRKRIGQHLRLLRRGGHHSIKLQRAWDKHGEDAFSFGVLARVEAHVLVQQEQAWIDFLDTAKYGYNMTATAGSLLGFKHTTETRQRMRAAKVGVPKSPAHVAAVAAALKGRVVPLAERQKMRAAKTRQTTRAYARGAASKYFCKPHRPAVIRRAQGGTVPGQAR